MAAALGFAAGEEKEGEREQVVEGGVFMLRGGPGSEGAVVEAPRRRRSWRQCCHCRHRKKKGGVVGPPCQGFFFFLFFRISSRVLYLIEAFKHF